MYLFIFLLNLRPRQILLFRLSGGLIGKTGGSSPPEPPRTFLHVVHGRAELSFF